MLKKITFNLILFSFLYYEKALASDEGMPQLNPEFWISQIFWLTIIFGSLYILLSKLILPKISNNLEMRKSQIAENIEAAEKQRNESDQKLKDYEKIINIVKNLDIPIIDIHKELFLTLEDPMSLYPLRLPGHYNELGYRLIAETILKKIDEYDSLEKE